MKKFCLESDLDKNWQFLAMASEEKSTKVIEFTRKDFKICSKKFVARANRKGYKGLLEGIEPIPTRDQVKCQATRGVTEAQNKKKLRRDYKLNELAYEYDKLFRACVKRKGQEQFHKVEIRKGPLREYDVIYREQVQQRVIASYFKQVKIRELRIWKGDVRSLAGTIGEMTDIY